MRSGNMSTETQLKELLTLIYDDLGITGTQSRLNTVLYLLSQTEFTTQFLEEVRLEIVGE